MIITIGGPIGSGTTTVAGELAARLGLRHIYAGEIFREMARERGMSLAEFSRYAEGNEEVDREIDERQKALAAQGDCIVEGRLSAHFVDADLKVWLTAPLEVRAARVAEREGQDVETATAQTREREASERRRYREIYGIDPWDLSAYDVVMNTEHWDAESIINLMELMIKSSKLR
ncbi:MAG: AAA family ATPase [Euryarchaeota archaeon]|nr:AAA family ATPase [Euryarchaeota archaeon]